MASQIDKGIIFKAAIRICLVLQEHCETKQEEKAAIDMTLELLKLKETAIS